MELNILKTLPGSNTSPKIIQRNIAENMVKDLPWLEQKQAHDRSIAVVAGGPSLRLRWPELENFEGDILACNGAEKFLRKLKVSPHYAVLLDARYDENCDFFDGIPPATECYMAMQCDPRLVDEVSEQALVTLYLTLTLDIFNNVKDIDKPKVALGGAAGTVGCKAVALAYALGYRNFHLYGFDSSYDEVGSEGNYIHHAYSQFHDDNRQQIDVYVDDQRFITNPTLANQAETFVPWAKELVAQGCSIELHCDGLLPALVAKANREGQEKSLERREQEKYMEIWKHDKYRKYSPGQDLAFFAFREMAMSTGDTLIDFGCGTGRAAVLFKQQMHMQVTCVDHAPNCLDQGIELPLIVTCLWELPDMTAQWGFCTDVMEHIPTEKVELVMEKLAKACKYGCFFQIATRDDNLGHIIGRKLHMTVIPAKAWYDVLRKYFEIVRMIEDEGSAIFCCFHRDELAEVA